MEADKGRISICHGSICVCLSMLSLNISDLSRIDFHSLKKNTSCQSLLQSDNLQESMGVSPRLNILGDGQTCSSVVCYTTSSFCGGHVMSCYIWYVEGRHRHILYFERLILHHVICFQCNINRQSELKPGNPTTRTRLQRWSPQIAPKLQHVNQTEDFFHFWWS